MTWPEAFVYSALILGVAWVIVTFIKLSIEKDIWSKF